MTFLFVIVSGLCAYLVWQNYQLEKRWRNLRYCWHMMSDFAGERLMNKEADPDLQTDFQWEQVVKEHRNMMSQFGVRPLGQADVDIYEAALLDRRILPLREHYL